MWQLWTVLLAKVCQKNSLSHSFAKTIGSKSWPWNHPQKHSCHGLQQSLPCFRFYLSGTCTHCGRAPKKKLQSTWSIRPRLLTHVHEQTTLSRYRWYRRNLEFTCPVVHFALEVQDMPKSDAEIWQMWIQQVSVSCAKWENFAIKAKHWSTDAIASFWWNHMALRLMPSVCQTPGRVDYVEYSTVHFLHVFSRHVSLQVYQQWMKLKSEDYN